MRNEIYAPYNFVPFSARVLKYPWDRIPAYGEIHDRLLTGEIALTMTAVTPVCIGNGDRKNPDFFKTPDGRYAIPGSSLRGLIRENMQILGHGKIVTFNNRDIEAGFKSGREHLADGLAPAHRQRDLDMVTGILGYAEKRDARRSRVGFGNLYVQDQARPQYPIKLLLKAPNPTRYGNYTLNTDPAGRRFILRGYKQYWLKPEAPADMSSAATSTLNPMPAGTRFRGTLTFRNLHPEELGLVLWALRLEAGCYQPIGRGKPYGYGRMTLEIDSLRLLDAKLLYSRAGLTAGLTPATERVDGYIQAFQKLSREKLGKDWNGNFEDFFYIRSTLRQDGYMSADAYRPEGARLPTLAELRQAPTAPEPEPEPQPEPEPVDPEVLSQSLEALRARFGGGAGAAAKPVAGKKKKKGRR